MSPAQAKEQLARRSVLAAARVVNQDQQARRPALHGATCWRPRPAHTRALWLPRLGAKGKRQEQRQALGAEGETGDDWPSLQLCNATVHAQLVEGLGQLSVKAGL